MLKAIRDWYSKIGKKGGRSKSAAKKKASRANGLRGGRPRRKNAI